MGLDTASRDETLPAIIKREKKKTYRCEREHLEEDRRTEVEDEMEQGVLLLQNHFIFLHTDLCNSSLNLLVE